MYIELDRNAVSAATAAASSSSERGKCIGQKVSDRESPRIADDPLTSRSPVTSLRTLPRRLPRFTQVPHTNTPSSSARERGRPDTLVGTHMQIAYIYIYINLCVAAGDDAYAREVHVGRLCVWFFNCYIFLLYIVLVDWRSSFPGSVCFPHSRLQHCIW